MDYVRSFLKWFVLEQRGDHCTVVPVVVTSGLYDVVTDMKLTTLYKQQVINMEEQFVFTLNY